MKRIFLLIYLFFVATLAHATNYCIFIDTFPFSKTYEKKIIDTLQDVAYPSYTIKDNHIFIFSGSFKNSQNANKLLPLTRYRYKYAEVKTCDTSKIYKGEELFQKKAKVVKEQVHYSYVKPQVEKKKQVKRSISPKCYTIQVYNASLAKSKIDRKHIKYTLNKLPQTQTTTMNNRFIIVSGKFTSKNTANTINKLIHNEFPNSKIISCIPQDKLKKHIYKKKPVKRVSLIQIDPLPVVHTTTEIIPSPDTTMIITSTPKVQTSVKTAKKTIFYVQDEIKEEPTQYIGKADFSILDLNNHAYISSDIASDRYYTSDSKLKKSDLQNAFNHQKESYFNGLYLKTNTAYDVQNSDPAFDVRLEFDIFDQGYYKNKKKNEMNRVKNKISFYKSIKNIEILRKDQELLKLRHYENSINVSLLLIKLHIKEQAKRIAYAKLQEGIITSFEYDNYIFDIQEIKDNLILFKNMTLLKIPRELWHLFNEIEHTHLIDENKLVEKLKMDSIDLKLANVLKEQKPLAEEWKDKLRVNVYAGVRKMYLSQNQTLIGVETKIPLSYTPATKELDDIQNSVLSTQAHIQHKQSISILHDAIANYRYKTQKLKTNIFQLKRLQKHIKDLQTIRVSQYASFGHFNTGDEQKSIDRYLKIYSELQLRRVDAYRELINIMYLIHASNLRDILKYSTPN